MINADTVCKDWLEDALVIKEQKSEKKKKKKTFLGRHRKASSFKKCSLFSSAKTSTKHIKWFVLILTPLYFINAYNGGWNPSKTSLF